MIWLVYLLVFLLVLDFLLVRKRPKNFPPGPLGLPIVGNLFQLQPDPSEAYSNLRKKYGDIFSVDLGSLRSVVLNDYKLVREAYSQSEFSGRPTAATSLDEKGITRGFGFAEGKQWSEQRRFVLKNLRDFGFGMKSIDARLQSEALETINELKSKVGVPIDMYEQFDAAAINSLWEVATGERFEINNPEFTRIRRLTRQIFRDGSTFFAGMMFPWLKHLRPNKQKAFAKTFTDVREIIKQKVATNRETYDSNVQRDLIDCYLKEISETTDPQSTFYKESGESNMVFSIAEMIFGGIETIGVVLSWLTLTMAHFPEVQTKLYAEIKEVVGLDNLPSLEHKKKMPYTQAVIMEVMRYTRFVPQTFHRTTANVQLSGFTIPKNTAVFANFNEIMGDPNVWGDPKNFRPERFISEDGQDNIKQDWFFPFSVGKRVCPGETYAKDQLFIFVTILFQNFIVDFDKSSKIPSFEGGEAGAFTKYPVPHKLVLQNRLE